MAIKLADTLEPMADFPAVEAKDVAFEDGENLQEKYDNGELGVSGEENKINSISVNGSFALIDENKNVDITVPSIEDLATESYVAEQISIQQSTVTNLSNQVDDVVAAVEGHTTSINTLQASVGDKANTSDVYTKDQVDNKISSSITSVYKYKGNVASFSDLNDVESPENAHVYFVTEDSLNYVYTDGSWKPLAGIIDLSDYVTDSDMTNALAGKANTTDIKTKTSQLENDSEFVTDSDMTNALAGKANTTDIKTKTSQLENDSEFATETYVAEQISNIPSVDLTDYAKKNEIPDVSGYVTEEQLLAKDYAVMSEMKTAIQNNRKLAALMAYMKCDDIKASRTAIQFVRSGAERPDGGYDMQEKDCRFTTGTSDTGSISITENIVTLCGESMIQITFEDYVDHLKFECYVPFDENITGTATYENQTYYYGSGNYATSLDDDSYIVTID